LSRKFVGRGIFFSLGKLLWLLHSREVIGESVDVPFRKTGTEGRHIGAGIMGFWVFDLLDDIFPRASAADAREVGAARAALAVDGMAFNAFSVMEKLRAARLASRKHDQGEERDGNPRQGGSLLRYHRHL